MRWLGLLLFALGSGCYGEYYTPSGYLAVAPPLPIVEAPPPQSTPGAVWTAGYWRWRGDRYDWVSGRWMVPPRPGVVYYPPSWRRGPTGFYQVPGRWLRGSPYRRVYYDALGRPHYF